MKKHRILLGAWMCAVAMLATSLLPANQRQDADEPAAADNTEMNKKDRKASEPTADQAKNNEADLQTMQTIRKSIVADKSLSTYAHNVKVIAQNGHVTLKGTVRSESEKEAVEAKASNVVGKENVTNKITIQGS